MIFCCSFNTYEDIWDVSNKKPDHVYQNMKTSDKGNGLIYEMCVSAVSAVFDICLLFEQVWMIVPFINQVWFCQSLWPYIFEFDLEFGTFMLNINDVTRIYTDK